MFKSFFKSKKKEDFTNKNILVAALLIHAAKIDEKYTDDEKKIIKRALIDLTNIDSDEVLYYVDGDFMSRNHVEKGYISLHPDGIPHGPHPGAMERSIGQKETQELAVMVDTFKPLKLTKAAMNLDDGEYYKSWIK